MTGAMTTRFSLPPSLVLTLAVAACGGTPVVSPPGLEPLEENLAPEPAPVGDDVTPEAVTTFTGQGAEFEFAHARGYVHAPLAKVYAAMQQAAVVVDRRHVGEFTVTPGVEPEFEVSFRVHNIVFDVVTVEFDTNWRQGVVGGTKEAPTQVAGRAAKVAGTAFIDRLEDSIVLTRVEGGLIRSGGDVTRFEMVRHIKSATAGSTEAEEYVRDVFANLVEASHDRALPSFNP